MKSAWKYADKLISKCSKLMLDRINGGVKQLSEEHK